MASSLLQLAGLCLNLISSEPRINYQDNFLSPPRLNDIKQYFPSFPANPFPIRQYDLPKIKKKSKDLDNKRFREESNYEQNLTIAQYSSLGLFVLSGLSLAGLSALKYKMRRNNNNFKREQPSS